MSEFWVATGVISYLIIGVFIARKAYADRIVESYRVVGSKRGDEDIGLAALVSFWPAFLVAALFMSWFAKPADRKVSEIEEREASIAYWQRKVDDTNLSDSEREAAAAIIATLEGKS